MLLQTTENITEVPCHIRKEDIVMYPKSEQRSLEKQVSLNILHDINTNFRIIIQYVKINYTLTKTLTMTTLRLKLMKTIITNVIVFLFSIVMLIVLMIITALFQYINK